MSKISLDYTKGNWTVAKYKSGDYDIVSDADLARRMAMVPTQNRTEGIANAILMASAPELAKAVIWAYNFARHSADEAENDKQERELLDLKDGMFNALTKAGIIKSEEQ